MRTPQRLAVVAGLTAGMAFMAVPATAQDPASSPIRFVAKLSSTPTAGKSHYVLPGDLTVKKSRGDRFVRKESLIDVVETLERLEAKGRSIGSTLTIKGKVYVVKGLPVIMDDGTVKVRVKQGRGSRALIVPRTNSTYDGLVCPPDEKSEIDAWGNPICVHD